LGAIFVYRYKIDTIALVRGWERYMIEIPNNPVSDIKKALLLLKVTVWYFAVWEVFLWRY